MPEGLYISDAAWSEFEGQSVFESVDDFVAAMPPATRSVHIVPSDIGKQADGFRPIANSEALFGDLTQTFTTPGMEWPEAEDESIWRVDHANDLPKYQGMRDETQIDMHPRRDPIDYDSISYPSPPGDFEDDYAINNYYRVFDSSQNRDLMAITVAYNAPVCLHAGSLLATGKQAVVWDKVVDGLSPTVIKAAQDCTVRLKRAQPKIGRWTFSVTSSKAVSTHSVHIKATRRKGTAAKLLPKLDIKVGCSCEFWKWQGPDYHAQRHGYLDRSPRSDGSPPNTRDPSGVNRVCKHVYAASNLFLKYSLQSVKKSSKTASAWPHSGLVNQCRVIPNHTRSVQRLQAGAMIHRSTTMASEIESVVKQIYTDQ